MRIWCNFQYPPQHPQGVGPSFKKETQGRKRYQKVPKCTSDLLVPSGTKYCTMISDLLVFVDLELRATDTEYHLLMNCQVDLGSSPRLVCQIVKPHFIVQMNQQFVKFILCPSCQIYITKSILPSCRHHVANVPTPLHPVDCTSALQAAQFKAIYGLPENYLFSAQTSAPKERLSQISSFHSLPISKKGSNQCWVGMYFRRYRTDRALKNLYTCIAWRGWACLNF